MNRLLLLALGLCFCSCSNPQQPDGDLVATGNGCIKKAETWLSKPNEKQPLKVALKAAQEANEQFKNDQRSEHRAILTDLDLLQGALNMAQTQVNNGEDPTRPTSMSEDTATNAVTVAVEQLRTDLTKLTSGPPAK